MVAEAEAPGPDDRGSLRGPMELALGLAVVSVAAGVAAALVADARLWVLAPVRAFAVAAVAVSIAVHLLPEAIDGAGLVVLVVAGAALLAPIVVGRVAAGLGDRHRRIAAELGFVAVLLHQLTDGLALGAATGHGGYHWDLLIGIAAHTVPLVAMLTLTFAELGGRRAVLLRAAAMIAATAVGIGLTRLDDQLVPAAGPWLGAAIAGLLLHVLLHDSGDRAVPRATRPLEAVGVALGAALPFVAGGEHHPGFASALGANLATVVLGAAPWIVIGGGLAVLAAPGHRRAPMTLIRIVAGPITAVALIVVAYVATAVEDLGSVGAAAAAATSLVPDPIALIAAIALGLLALALIAERGLLTWLGTGHSHGHSGHGPTHAHDHAAPVGPIDAGR
jgi:hypothetical protein